MESVISWLNPSRLKTNSRLTRSQQTKTNVYNVELYTLLWLQSRVSSKHINIFLKDSITSWEVLAVSLSEDKGICVSKPYNIRVMKSFSIDLQLPYAVVRNEQVEIRTILYNYDDSDLRVRVEWTYDKGFCSLSTEKSNYFQFVTVKAASSLAIPFVIVPLTVGYQDVEVKAAVVSPFIGDGIKKKLLVLPEGRRVVQTLANVILDPEGRGRDGVQEELIRSMDIKNVVPNTEVETYVTVQGTVISQLVEKVIHGTNLNHLIIHTFGSGEINMIGMATNVIATHYLDVTGQWEKVGIQHRSEAINHITNGLRRQLTFRKSDGSYASSLETPSSTWLTAYVVKVFALAQTLINIEQHVLCDSLKWLIMERQKPDGFFQENSPVYHQEMVGGTKTGAVELESTLTAFILIALLESEDSCTEHVNLLKISIQKSTAFIEEHYPHVRRPYSIAITSYALAIAGRLSNITKLMSACTDNNRWEEPVSRDLTLEATSYGLLTLVKMGEYDKAEPVARWLTEQKFYGQGWRSIQSTITAFQSMAQYYLKVPLHKNLDMEVALRIPGLSNGIRIKLNNQNALVARSYQTLIQGDVVVTAAGKGQGSLSVFSVYYAPETEKERSCNNFNLSLKVQNEPLAKAPDGILSTVSLTICIRYLKSQDSGMAIVQVSMMTGIAVDFIDLNRSQKGEDKNLLNFEFNKEAFDKRILVLYVDQISHTQDKCLKFNLHQYFKVGLIQPASVTVYEYSSPEHFCTKFYHVEEDSNLLCSVCEGEVCRCFTENCYMKQRLEKVDSSKRLFMACETGVDYVYKTTLVEIKEQNNYFIYVMDITVIIKAGTDAVKEHQKRNFISHPNCSKTLNLQVGQDYLMWGMSKDMLPLDSGYSYWVTGKTWIEIWPKDKECQKAEHENLCDDLDIFSNELQLYGCYH